MPRAVRQARPSAGAATAASSTHASICRGDAVRGGQPIKSTTVARSLVRIFCTAPSLSDAHRVHLNAHQVQFDGGVAIAAGYAPVEVDDVEIEWEHTSEYDADGKEIAPVGRRR